MRHTRNGSDRFANGKYAKRLALLFSKLSKRGRFAYFLKRQSGDASLTSLRGKAGTLRLLPQEAKRGRFAYLLKRQSGDASLTKQPQVDYAQAVSL